MKIKTLLTTLFVAVVTVSFAQQMSMPNLPLNPKIKSGKLENGLTYYIVKNSEPKGQAEFYIAQKVGAILEEENQRGLAHFLEHMAFNGTKNFPDNKLISWLESVGVKFGENLNAYTSIDQTVYNISNVPISREGIMDSCLLILHDWSCAISLNDKDIDKERGVIREELRTRSSAQMRMLEKILPELYPDSKYGHRLPGGLVSVIDNFTYEELKAYYKKWYRPDLQGIIVVGDFDPAVIEAKIKKLFGAIPKPVNAADRTQFNVPDTKDPIFSIASDTEASNNQLMISFKHDVLPENLKGTAAYIIYDYFGNIVSNMLRSRLSEIAQKADAPFTGASASYGDYLVSQTKSAFEVNAIAKEGGIERALKAIVVESERVRKFGFTASEYERAKASYLSRLEQQYKEREKQKNSYYVDEALNHFLFGNATPGVETEYALIQQFQAIPLEQVNQYAKGLPKLENLTIALMMPKKSGIIEPTKDQLYEVYKSALLENIEAYKEVISNDPLVAKEPISGKVVSSEVEPISGGVIWKLSNGAVVIIKKTDFKEDQVLFNASSRGGFSNTNKADIINTKVLTDVMSLGGLGSYSAVDLRKVLAGKNVSINSSVALNTEAITGNSSPKDLETFLQLLYLQFTGVREDQEAYGAYKARMETQLQNLASNPMQAYSDTLQKVLYSGNPYSERLTLDMLSKIVYKKALELARVRFSNAADFTFTFVGNVDVEKVKPLVEKYIASLPGNSSKKENWKDVGMTPAKDNIIKSFDKEMETPKATIYAIYNGKMSYDVESKIMSNMMEQVFNMVFTRTIREEEQGTYGVGVMGNQIYFPDERYLFFFGFDTDVALKERLLNRAYKEIENVMQNGVKAEDFAKIIEYMTKSYAEKLRENGYWLSVISSKYLINKDMHSTYESTLKSVTIEKLNKFIKDQFSNSNRIELVMLGQAKKAS